MSAVTVADVTMEFRLIRERQRTLKESVVKLLRGERARPERFLALENVDFRVERGEALGIIGHNGSGKTTLLRILAGILFPTKGKVDVRGRVTTIIDLGAGFNPELSGEENIYLAGALYGFSRREMSRRFESIVEFAELQHFIQVPTKNYSSGMRARLGFAVATEVDPEVLIVDEVLAVGDEAFQRKCFARMNGFRDSGKTIIIVTHDLAMVERFCDRAILLDHGHLLLEGATVDVIRRYLEPAGGDAGAA